MFIIVFDELYNNFLMYQELIIFLLYIFLILKFLKRYIQKILFDLFFFMCFIVIFVLLYEFLFFILELKIFRKYDFLNLDIFEVDFLFICVYFFNKDFQKKQEK